jgi:hypothetical protein
MGTMLAHLLSKALVSIIFITSKKLDKKIIEIMQTLSNNKAQLKI